jgi:ligand-binding sensor domain-containing protein
VNQRSAWSSFRPLIFAAAGWLICIFGITAAFAFANGTDNPDLPKLAIILILICSAVVLNSGLSRLLLSHARWLAIPATLIVFYLLMQIGIFAVVGADMPTKLHNIMLSSWLEENISRVNQQMPPAGLYEQRFGDFLGLGFITGSLIWLASLAMQLFLFGYYAFTNNWLRRHWRAAVAFVILAILWMGVSELVARGNITPSHQVINLPADTMKIPINVSVETILIDSRGEIWVGLRNGGVYHRYPQSETWEELNSGMLCYMSAQGLYHTVTTLLEMENGDILAGTDEDVYHFSRTNRTWERFGAGFPNDAVLDLVRTQQGQIWAATHSNIFYFDPNKNEWGLAISGLPNIFSPNISPSLLATQDGKLWVGIKNSIYQFDTSRMEWQPILADIPLYITRLTQTKDQQIWLTGSGIARLDPSSRVLEVVNTGSEKIVTEAILQTRDGRILAGTTGGIYQIEPKNQVSEKADSEIGFQSVNALGETIDGKLWAGVDDAGVFVSESEHQWHPNNQGLPVNTNVQTVLETRDGQLWVGLFHGGTYRFNPKLQVWEPYRMGLMGDIDVQKLYQSRDGSIWAGASSIDGKGRMYRLNPRSFLWELTWNGLDKCGIIWSITETSDQQLWVGCQKDGLNMVYRFDPELQKWEQAIDGLTTANIVPPSLISLPDGKLYIGTAAPTHTYRFEPRTKRWEDASHGLPELGAAVMAIAKSKDDALWVGLNSFWSGNPGLGTIYRFRESTGWQPVTNGLPYKIDINLFLETRDGELLVDITQHENDALSSVYRFDPRKESWEPLGSGLLAPAESPTLIETSDRKIVAGLWGQGQNGVYMLDRNAQDSNWVKLGDFIKDRPTWVSRDFEERLSIGFTDYAPATFSYNPSSEQWVPSNTPISIEPRGVVTDTLSKLTVGLAEHTSAITVKALVSDTVQLRYGDSRVWFSVDGLGWSPLISLPLPPLSAQVDSSGREITLWTFNGQALEQYTLRPPAYLHFSSISLLLALGRSSVYRYLLIMLMTLTAISLGVGPAQRRIRSVRLVKVWLVIRPWLAFLVSLLITVAIFLFLLVYTASISREFQSALNTFFHLTPILWVTIVLSLILTYSLTHTYIQSLSKQHKWILPLALLFTIFMLSQILLAPLSFVKDDPRASLDFALFSVRYDILNNFISIPENSTGVELLIGLLPLGVITGCLFWLICLGLGIILESIRHRGMPLMLKYPRKLIMGWGILVSIAFISYIPVVLPGTQVQPVKDISISKFSFESSTRSDITAILKDSHNQLWVGLQHGGLYRFDPIHGAWENEDTNLQQQGIYAILETPDGEIWAGSSTGAYRFDPAGRTWVSISDGLDQDVYDMLVTHNGQLWSAGNQGAYQFFPLEKRWKLFDAGLPDRPRIRNLLETSDGQLLAGLRQTSGVYRFNTEKVAWESISTGLPLYQDNMAQSIFHDSHRQLYAAPAGMGVYRFDDILNTWVMDRAGLPDYFTVWTFEETDDGCLWVGSARDGIYQRCKDSERWQPLNEGLPPSASINQLKEIKPGELWAGLSGNGLYRLDVAGRIWRPFNLGLPIGMNGSGLIETSGGVVVASLRNYDVYRLDSNKNILEPIPGNGYKISPNVLSESREANKVWVGGLNTIEKCDLNQDCTWITRAGLPGTFEISALLESPNHSLWIGLYQNGIYQLKPGSEKWLDASQGLRSGTTVYTFLEAGNNLLYAGSSDGVYQMNYSSSTWEQLNKGMMDFVPSISHLIRTRNGVIWAGSYHYQKVYRWDIQSNAWKLVNNGLPKDSSVWSLVETQSGQLLAGLWQNENIYRYNPESNAWEITDYPSLPKSTVYKLIHTKDGQLLAGMESYGIFKLTGQEQNLKWEPINTLVELPDWAAREEDLLVLGFESQGPTVFEYNSSAEKWEPTSRLPQEYLLTKSSRHSWLALGLPGEAVDVYQPSGASHYWFSYSRNRLWVSPDGISWNAVARLSERPIGAMLSENGRSVTIWSDLNQSTIRETTMSLPFYSRIWPIAFLLATGRSPFYQYSLLGFALIFVTYIGIIYLLAGRTNRINLRDFLRLDWKTENLLPLLQGRDKNSYTALRLRVQEISTLAQMMFVTLPVNQTVDSQQAREYLSRWNVAPEQPDIAAALATLSARQLFQSTETGYRFSNPELASIYQNSLKAGQIAKMAEQVRSQNPAYLNALAFFEQNGFQVIEDPSGFLFLKPGGSHLVSRIGETVVASILQNQPVQAADIQAIVSQTKVIYREPTELQGRTCIILFHQPPDSEARALIYEYRFKHNFTIILISHYRMRAALASNTCKQELELILNEYLGGRLDLYDLSIPVRDENFFGRQQVVDELLAYLDRRQPIGIFALNKMGKTSLIRNLADRLSDHIIVQVDLQTLPSEARAVYSEVIRGLARDASQKWDGLLLPVFQLTDPGLGGNPTQAFIQDITSLHSALAQRVKDAHFVVFIDEIDRLIPGEDASWATGFAAYNDLLAALRGLSQGGIPLTFVVAGVRARINRTALLAGVENPGFQMFRELFLPPLSRSECDQMVTDIGQQMGLKYTPAALAHIYAESGGYPFLARQLCSLAWIQVDKTHSSSGIATLDQADILGATHAYLNDGRRNSYLEQLWETRLNVEEQKTLRRIARGTKQRQKGERSVLNNLVERHLILEDNSDYHLAVGLFRRWIRLFILNLEEEAD